MCMSSSCPLLQEKYIQPPQQLADGCSQSHQPKHSEQLDWFALEGNRGEGFCSVFMLNGLLKSVWALQNKCWMLSVLSFCKTSVNHYAQTCVSDTELGSDALTNQPMHQLCAFFNQMHWNSAVPVRIVSCISRMVVLTFSFLSLSLGVMLLLISKFSSKTARLVIFVNLWSCIVALWDLASMLTGCVWPRTLKCI